MHKYKYKWFLGFMHTHILMLTTSSKKQMSKDTSPFQFSGQHCRVRTIKTMFSKLIIIIIMSCHQHGHPWPSLAAPPYRPLLPAGLQCYILYWHRPAVCRFELVVLPFFVHVKGSTKYITYELIPTSPAVSYMSGSSNFDSFCDGW